MYFYELHEGDAEVYADVLLVREDEMAPETYFDIVQEIRRRVQDSFEHETLIEAIADELERDHGFLFISDDRLTAAANVSRDEAENFLADLDGMDDGEGQSDQGDRDDLDENGEFRTIYAEVDPESQRN